MPNPFLTPSEPQIFTTYSVNEFLGFNSTLCKFLPLISPEHFLFHRKEKSTFPCISPHFTLWPLTSFVPRAFQFQNSSHNTGRWTGGISSRYFSGAALKNILVMKGIIGAPCLCCNWKPSIAPFPFNFIAWVQIIVQLRKQDRNNLMLSARPPSLPPWPFIPWFETQHLQWNRGSNKIHSFIAVQESHNYQFHSWAFMAPQNTICLLWAGQWDDPRWNGNLVMDWQQRS